MPTLTVTEILSEINGAIIKEFPYLQRMGLDFRPQSLKLNKTYDAHILGRPSVSTYDGTTGYANGAVSARSLLTDVPVLVDTHRHVPIYWKHLDALKDDKNKYEELVALTGEELARALIDNLLSGVGTQNFSQESIYATADCDVDMLINITGDMNGVAAASKGRILIINTDVANALQGDSRMMSKDYAGFIQGADGIRSWTNVHGFALIQEYADFPSNNGTAVALTAEADDDVITATAHGLVVGDRVTFPTLTGGTGLTAGTTVYYVKTVPTANTFTVSATQGGATLNITADASAGTVKKTENLVAFAFERRAFAVLAGVPDQADQAFLDFMNIPRTQGMEIVTHKSGVSMAMVGWQNGPTGDVYTSPTMVWGKSLGRQGYANGAGGLCDYAGHRIISA